MGSAPRDDSHTERTYDPPATTALPDLDGLPDVTTVSGPERLELDAVCFDTDDLRLAAAGISLQRRIGCDAGWHLSLPDSSETATQVRFPLGEAGEQPPGELATALLAHTRGRTLEPVATLRTSRSKHGLLARDGTYLATICVDEVAASDVAADAQQVWQEWKVELVQGTPAVLEAADTRLRRAGAKVASGNAKPLQVLADRLPAPRKNVRPHRRGRAGAVLQARLADQVETLKLRDIDVRRDFPDGVHDLRVSMRRLRSALATFRPLVDREVTDPARDDLQWIGRLLGEARDAEVLGRRVRETVTEQPAGLLPRSVSTRVEDALDDRYRAGLTASLRAMESTRYLDLLTALDGLVSDPPWTPLAEEAARDVVPRLLRRDWRRLRRAVPAAADATDPHARDLALHESRKAAKRLRYAAEAAASVVGKRADRLVEAGRTVQDLLGDHQDSVVARSVLLHMVADEQLDADSALTLGVLLGLEHGRGEAVVERFWETWPRLARDIARALG